jgi:hypothetical protein
MRTRIALVTATALAFAGCGNHRDQTAAERPSRTPAAERAGTPAGACPEGTKPVTAAELVPHPARGYSLAPSDPAVTRAIVTPLKAALRDRWRGHDEKVLARDEASRGTLLLVINSTERTSGTDAIVAGILDSGHDGEPITVRGEQTKLVRTADDTYVTAGIAGECAVLLLFAGTEADVRDAVKQIE